MKIKRFNRETISTLTKQAYAKEPQVREILYCSTDKKTSFTTGSQFKEHQPQLNANIPPSP